MSENYENGAYQAKILDHGVYTSKKGNPTFFLDFQILNKVGGDGANMECPQGERTYYKAVMNSTIGWLCDDLKAIGVEFDSLAKLNPQAEGAVKMIGRVITVVCEHKPDESGKLREQWGFRRATRNKLSEEDLRKLDNAFAHLLPKKRAAAPPPRPNNSNETI
jgi:hypothetical protein